MPMADHQERMRLYGEYKELDDQYRQLAEKLKPFMLTTTNRPDHERLLEIGRKLSRKLEELNAAFGVKRIPPSP